MRKVLLLTISAVFTFLTSCERTYTCGCTDGTPDNIVYTKEIKAKNKSEAREQCQSMGDECDCL